MILSIKHKVGQEIIHHQKQTQINKDNICGNNKRVDHNYKVGDKFMITNDSAYKYVTPHNGLFVITQWYTNGTVTLHCGLIKVDIIYVGLSHINLVQMLKILTFKIYVTTSTYDHQLYTSILY